jgi:hypothetical protein
MSDEPMTDPDELREEYDLCQLKDRIQGKYYQQASATPPVFVLVPEEEGPEPAGAPPS